MMTTYFTPQQNIHTYILLNVCYDRLNELKIITNPNKTNSEIQPTNPNAHNCHDSIGDVWSRKIDQDDHIFPS